MTTAREIPGRNRSAQSGVVWAQTGREASPKTESLLAESEVAWSEIVGDVVSLALEGD